MGALLRKDLREQRPFLWFVLLFDAASWLDVAVNSYPDLAAPRSMLDSVMDLGPPGMSLLHFLVAFSIASGLLIRGFEDRTMEFLDGLPVSRSRVFVAKLTTALGILALMPLSDAALAALHASLSVTSLRPHVPWGLIATGAGLRLAQIVVFLALGILLSFLHRFAWVAMGVLFWLYVAATAWAPATTALNPFLLSKPVFEGTVWIVPWRELAIQVVLAAVCVCAAHVLFLRKGDRLGIGREPASRRTRWLAGGALAAVSVALALSVMARLMRDDESHRSRTASYAGFGTGRARTAHYSISYPTNMTARAQNLARIADVVHDRVVDYLQLPTGDSSPISVDATGSATGTAGTARSTKIRLDLSSTDDLLELAAVLGHETTHSYVDLLSRDRASRTEGSQFLQEGLATHVEYAVFRSERDLDHLRAMAGALHRRRLVDLEQLLDDDALRKRLDPDVVYPLGEAFVAALIAGYGRDAPLRVLHELGRENAARNLSAMEAWRDAFQSAGIDFEAVSAGFFRRLDAWARRYANEIANWPPIRSAARVGRQRVTVDFQDEASPGFAIGCRFRARPETPRSEYRTVTLRDVHGPASCWVSRAGFSSTSFWYQVGYMEVGTNRALYEPWVEVPLN